jgi:hypothetical protein
LLLNFALFSLATRVSALWSPGARFFAGACGDWKQAKTGAVTIIQHFGSALNLNIHFHMLFLEGAIRENNWGGTTFTRIKALTNDDRVTLVHTISQRIACIMDHFFIQKIQLCLDDKDLSLAETGGLLPLMRAPRVTGAAQQN